MIKRLTIALLAILPLVALSSCTEETYQSAYQYQITTFYSSSSDLTELVLITDMYEEYDITVNETFYASGESYTENDDNAIAEFQAKMVSIPETKIENLGLTPGTYYTISLVKALASTEESGILESYSYPILITI